MARKLALVIGPESSGTRILTAILSQHPKILGTPDASPHGDVLDEVWRQIAQGDVEKAREVFPNPADRECVLTRRSLPHALNVGEPARYMDFSNLAGLHALARQLGLDLILLITTRSTAANLASWTATRSSPGKSLDKARQQYFASYLHIFSFLQETGVPFFLLSLEAFLLDRHEYVQSVFQMLGLDFHPLEITARADVNRSRYWWYFTQREQGCWLPRPGSGHSAQG